MEAVAPDAFEVSIEVVRAANARGIPLKLLGGQAVRVLCPLFPHRARDDQDMDFACVSSKKREVIAFFDERGFMGDSRFNTLHGDRQMYFTTADGKTSVDVVMNKLNMCHVLDFSDRIDRLPDTLDVTDLLLTKLQIAQLNEKDIRDALALLEGHPVGDADGETVNAGRIAALCGADWGLWRTITGNLDTCCAMAPGYDVPNRAEVEARLQELLRRIEAEPKTRAWRLRAKIGDRKRWYELPDEVAGGP